MNKEEYQKNQDSKSINHFYEKLLLLKAMMNATEERKLAEHRQAVMQEFLNEFMIECEGEQSYVIFINKRMGNTNMGMYFHVICIMP